MKTSESEATIEKLRQAAAEAAETRQCNCDLDKWEPERSTGHSHVCRIHKAARMRVLGQGEEMTT
jgi:hypothetical protein